MISTKSIKISKKTATIVFETSDENITNLNRHEIVALSLLTGFYNPLRKYSNNDTPIDIEKLNEFSQQFNNLINDVIGATDIDVEEINEEK